MSSCGHDRRVVSAVASCSCCCCSRIASAACARQGDNERTGRAGTQVKLSPNYIHYRAGHPTELDSTRPGGGGGDKMPIDRVRPRTKASRSLLSRCAKAQILILILCCLASWLAGWPPARPVVSASARTKATAKCTKVNSKSSLKSHFVHCRGQKSPPRAPSSLLSAETLMDLARDLASEAGRGWRAGPGQRRPSPSSSSSSSCASSRPHSLALPVRLLPVMSHSWARRRAERAQKLFLSSGAAEGDPSC